MVSLLTRKVWFCRKVVHEFNDIDVKNKKNSEFLYNLRALLCYVGRKEVERGLK